MNRDKILRKYDLDECGCPDIEFEFIDMDDFFYEDRDDPYLPHIHSYYQILWFQKGKGVHYVDFNEYPVEENTLFFIAPGQIHYFERNTAFKGVIIHFNETFLSDENSSENVFLKYNVFNAFDTVPYYNINMANSERLEYIIEELRSELGNSTGFAHHDYLKHLIKMFLINIQRNGKRGTGIPLCINNSANRTFVRFRQCLEHNYKELHTVKEYAVLLNVSGKTLTNYVIESTQTTPLKIINERIILEAKRQLRHSSLKVKEKIGRASCRERVYVLV